MRTLANIILVSFFGLMSFLGFVSNDKTVCPTPATMTVESDWVIGSIYDISIVDGVFTYNDTECLVSVPLECAIRTIINRDDTAFGDFDCEFKYIPEEDIYIANIIDEFVEL